MDKKQAGDKVFPGASLARLRDIWESLDDELTSRQLLRDVKTIYVSYTDADRNLVVAVHPDSSTDSFEMALALPTHYESPLLHDATHLKWRTLPVAVRVETEEDLSDEVFDLIDRAIAHAPEAVATPTEQFARFQRRERWSRRPDQ